MRAFVRCSWLLSLAGFIACGAGKEHAAPFTQGGTSSGGTVAGKGGASGGTASGGSSSLAGRSAAGSAGEGGESGLEAGGTAGDQAGAPPTASVCPQKASWGLGLRFALSTDGDDVLGAVTPDELSVVWLSDGKVLVADRASRSADFASVEVTVEGGDYFAQVALSPDGLTLVGVRLDGTGFGLLTRAARGDRFEGPLGESPFDALYGAPAANLSNGPFADPVFGGNGTHLLYSALELDSNRAATIYDAREAGGTWPWGTPVLGALLYAEGGAFRRPTALSADQRTLFYWDEVASEERATWRSRLDAAFSGWESLGTRRNATPNAACDRLYYSAPGSGGNDLFVSERN